MADPLVLSGSSINTYLRCPKQWEYAYVKRIRSRPTLRLAIGSAGHTAIERDLKQKLWTEQDLPLEEMQETFRDEFMKEALDAEDTAKETKGQALDSGVKSVSKWRRDVAPATEPIMVEEPIQYSLNGVPVSGTIDVVKKGDIIGDWKITAKTPEKKGNPGYLLSLVGYAIGFRKLTGRVETGLVLDHIVRLKTPTHVPIESKGAVPDDSIRAYAGIVDDVARGIQGGNFPPSGLQGTACSWCGYRDICPAYRAATIGG
jgi:CRISPR/Cas system-associated exonuclease Cas4 (RecB family)